MTGRWTAAARRRLTRTIDARAVGRAEPGPYEIEIQRDLRVPMDDGVELLADLITPVGAPAGSATILLRGPYGRRGLSAVAARSLARQGCTVIYQSCRGTFGSGGRFTPFVDEEADGLATHRWVRAQPWFSGTLVTYGPSYLGFTQWAVAGRLRREQPDEAPDGYVLLITTPDFGAPTWYGGTFSLQTALGWSRTMDRIGRGSSMLTMMLPDPKLRRAFGVLPLGRGDVAATGHPLHWYRDWIAHELVGDDYWERISYESSVTDITAPVLMVTGWYDLFLPWQLRTYAALVEAGNQPWLTIGPWAHVSPQMAGPTHADTVAFLRERVGDTPSTRRSPVRAYRTGAERWHDLPAWPPPGVTGEEWFLRSDGGFGPAGATGGLTSYVYEPNDPTPSVGGPSLERATTLPEDNARHERRRDVISFRSAPLAAPLTLAGESMARLRVRGSAPSFDVFVRITDVRPDGRVITVCDGIRRIGSIATREGDPAPDEDGFREIEIVLLPTFHEFAAEHRIGVQISSGSHPLYARNPGTGEPAASAERTVPSRQEISHDGPWASRIELPVWPG